MSCPKVLGLHALWRQAREQYAIDEMRGLESMVHEMRDGLRHLNDRYAAAEQILTVANALRKRVEDLERWEQEVHLVRTLRTRSALFGDEHA